LGDVEEGVEGDASVVAGGEGGRVRWWWW